MLMGTLGDIGDIIEISLPVDPQSRQSPHHPPIPSPHPTNPSIPLTFTPLFPSSRRTEQPRGFAFITYSSPLDAQDAIDNYDYNELPGHVGKGRYLKVNLARPDSKGLQSGPKGDQAGE